MGNIKVRNGLEAGKQLELATAEVMRRISADARAKAFRTLSLLEKSAFEVLSHPGTGRLYGTHRASSPGETPAPDTGRLRQSWRHSFISAKHGKKLKIGAKITNTMPYSGYLESGTRRMAPRPYCRAIAQAATMPVRRLMECVRPQ